MLNQYETFITLFNQLKKRSNGSPDTLRWLSENNKVVRKLAACTGDAAIAIRKEFASNPGRSAVVPPEFREPWRDYEDKFKEAAEDISECEKSAEIEKILNALQIKAVDQGIDQDQFISGIIDDIRAKRPLGSTFDPVKDDPAALVNAIVTAYINSFCDDSDDDDADKAVGAWKFFEDALNLRHDSIYKKWKYAPHCLIPSQTDDGNLRPIFHLYEEAVRCYAYGCNIASISMCRALMEHVLTRHYKIKAENLESTISIAEIRFSKLQNLDMHGKRRMANYALHRYEQQSSIEDRCVVDFLKTIKFLIENIPHEAG